MITTMRGVESLGVVVVAPAPVPDHRWLRRRQRRRPLTSRSGFSDSCRSTAGRTSRITAHTKPMGELALALAISSSLQDALLDWFVQRLRRTSPQTGERSCWMSIPPTIPTYGQQQLSFFNGGYDQHMYHPLLVFERHTGCLLAARLRRGKVCQSRPHLCLCCCASSATAERISKSPNQTAR